MADEQVRRPNLMFEGHEYPSVSPVDFTIDECRVLWHWAGMGPDGIAELTSTHVGVIAAMIEVSVTRSDPRVNNRRLRQLIGKLTRADLEEVLADFPDDADEDETPQSAPLGATGTSETTGSSGTEPTDSSGTGAMSLAAVPDQATGPGGSEPISESVSETLVG